MLGEFFAASADEIDDALVEDGPHGRLPTVEAKGLSEVNLATLGEILGVGTYEDLVERAAIGRDSSSGEAGVLTVPSELRDALASSEDLTEVAKQWAATEELALDHWQAEDAVTVLRDLGRLSRDAREHSRGLWYWWSV